jgi:hypothetical protein
MPLPLAAIARAVTVASRANTGRKLLGGGGKVGHVEDMTATYLSEAKDLVEAAVSKGGKMVQAKAIELVGSGPHTPATSKPGNPPFLVTGNLRRNIESEDARSGWGEFISRVGPGGTAAVYGGALELGYAEGGLLPRPYLRPAFDSELKEIQQMIGEAIKKTSERKSLGRDVMTGRFTSGGG